MSKRMIRFRALVRKELLATLKEKTSRMILVGPLLLYIILFGYIASFNLNHIPYALCDLSGSEASSQFVRAVDNNKIFERVATVQSVSQIKALMDEGEALLTVVIEPQFAQHLKEGKSEKFKKISRQIKKIEHEADALRRSIENQLYSNNLLPDLRADVLQLTENLDRIINKFDEATYMFYVEQPEIPEEYHAGIKDLGRLSADCAENMGMASRSFFRDMASVRDYSQKVYFTEHESDICSRQLLEKVFDSFVCFFYAFATKS